MGSVTRRVVTFYSFKGGVGRSFALCDAAVYLARWGYRVLCVDFDLEAPGLDRYFSPWISDDRPGVLEILEAWSAGTDDVGLSNHAVFPLAVPGTDGRLSLVRSGRRRADYVRRLRAIDWNRLFEAPRSAGRRLEALRERWLESFDIVLVDSRTGWSDVGEICTIHLPDVLVCLFTPNEQSFAGSLEVADASKNGVARLPLDRGILRVVPVLTRVDKDEYEAQQQWTNRLLQEAGRFVNDWDPEEETPAGLLGELVVPYVPYWAYGERLAALRTEVVSSLSVGRSHQNLAALIARGLSEAALLMKHRDSYVDGAAVGASSPTKLSSSADYDVYISYPREHTDLARALADALKRRSVRVFLDSLALQPGDQWRDVLQNAQSRSRTFVAIFGEEPPRPGSPREEEISNALARAHARSARLIPVVLADWVHVPPEVRAFQGVTPAIHADGVNADELADELLPAILRS